MEQRVMPSRGAKKVILRPPPAPAPGKIRVLLVDDHQMMREEFRHLIEAQADMIVVAEASDGEMGVQLAREFHPDVVLMDVSMPKLNGIQATAAIMKSLPGVKVIAVTLTDAPGTMNAMQGAGAVDYLFKGDAFDVLCPAIRKHAGRPVARRASKSARR